MRYRLRTLLIGVTLLCVGLGIVVERARRQRSAVEALSEVYAEIQYDCDTEPRQTSQERYRSLSVNCLHSVVWLGLDSPAVTDDTLAYLEDFPHLEMLLIIEGCNISSDSLIHLRSVPYLKHLVIGSGTVDDRGLAHVATLRNLEELHIYYQDSISDSGIQHLHALKKLRHLTLSDTAVTKEGVASLQIALPECEIYWP